MKWNWKGRDCDQLTERLKQAAQYAIALQGAAKAGAEASEWQEVTEDKLCAALESIARFCKREGVGQWAPSL